MEAQKLHWYIIEAAIRDLNMPDSMLTHLVRTLGLPSSASPPPHSARLFLLRGLLSLTSSSPLKALETLEYLACCDLPAPPPLSLCRALSSLLSYLPFAPNVSPYDVLLSVARMEKYPFYAEVKATLSEVDDDAGAAIARDMAMSSVKGFVEDEFRAMEPPFLLSVIQHRSTATTADTRNINSDEASQDAAPPNINQIHQPQTRHGTGISNNIGTGTSNLSCAQNTETHTSDATISGTSSTGTNNLNGAQNDGTGTSNPNGAQNNGTGTSNLSSAQNNGTGTNNLSGAQNNGTGTSNLNSTQRNEARTSDTTSSGTKSNGEMTRKHENIKNAIIPKKRRRVLKWDKQEEELLKEAGKLYGKGNWKLILNTYRNEFKDRTAVDLKDKWRNLNRRFDLD